MFVKIVFILALLAPLSSNAYVRIGNGGEGVLVDDQVYVRDLYEQGSHLHPRFGSQISTSLLGAWNNTTLAKQFSSEKSLVLQKLTDIEMTFPGLGFATMQALEKYNYLFVDMLELLANDSPTVPESQRIQIAVRYYKTIYLSKTAWGKMSLESKAALLIHEGLYGLAKITCDENDCQQKSKQVRPLIGRFFSSASHDELKALIRENLDVQSLENLCTDPAAKFQFSIVSEKNMTKVFESFNSAYLAISEDFWQDVHKICQLALPYKDQKVLVKYEGLFLFQSIGVTIYKMNTQGEWQTQQGFSTKHIDGRQKKFVSFESSENCELHLRHLFTQSLETLKKMPNLDPSLICEQGRSSQK